jgi:DNA ligase-1
MRQFCRLYKQLDRSDGTSERVATLVAYFAAAPAADAAWALHCLLGKRRRRLITARRLRQIALEACDLPAWLGEASYAQVGDSAETIALLVGQNNQQAEGPNSQRDDHQNGIPSAAGPSTAYADPASRNLQEWMERILPPLGALPEAEQSVAVRQLWSQLTVEEVLVMVKLLTGTLRVGVGPALVVRALAELGGLESAEVQHRLMGEFTASAASFQALLQPGSGGERPASQPYPFLLACPLEAGRLEHEPASAWVVEWNWDGIRGQLIRRGGQGFLWSRGEELINGSFPDLVELAGALAEGSVLDGEVLIWPDGQGRPEPFAVLQRRLGRRRPTQALLRQCPAVFLAYDLLESEGVDRRGEPLDQRRQRLAALVDACRTPALRLSQDLPLAHWSALEPLRQGARQAGAEGLMLKQRAAAYGSGRRRGSWWKHKLDPLRLDAVLLYARNGSGRRANLYTDYTFGLWQDSGSPGEAPDGVAQGETTAGQKRAADQGIGGAEVQGRRLVSFASAYSGLDDGEILELDRWIRRNTTERFGPVRAVSPELVFELAFEGVQRSGRHRSGLAVRFPRISRWRRDKPAAEADTLAAALDLISA